MDDSSVSQALLTFGHSRVTHTVFQNKVAPSKTFLEYFHFGQIFLHEILLIY